MKTIAIRLPILAIATCTCAGLTSCGDSKEEAVDTNAATGVMKEALDRYDSDNDGIFSAAERQKMEVDFVEHFDADSDGELSGEERATARRNSKSTVVAGSRAPATLESAVEFLSRFDADGDGKLTEAETGEKRWKVMARADRNRDGFLTAEEWLAGNARPGVGQISE